ncbi:MAG: phosphatidate cytidylyltransferase [Bacteroidales bacterium]|nr:phosphatidate cytidylyltransferase [Bacteroidales bacterium]
MALSKNLIQRTVFGAMLVATIVVCVIWCRLSFFLLTAVIALFSINEFYRLTTDGDIRTCNYIGHIVCTTLLFYAAYELLGHPETAVDLSISCIPLAFYVLMVIMTFISQLFNTQGNALQNLAFFALGQLWIALPCALLYYLEFYKGSFTPQITLACFIAIWSNDTFAYCTGSLIGKHKMFERISPKKTWEGFIGGAVGAVVVTIVYSHFVASILPLWAWMGLALVVVVFGTFGDLLESMLKRTIGVKDSGNLIPGHGGMLDRFDSMMLAVPAVCTYLFLISEII